MRMRRGDMVSSQQIIACLIFYGRGAHADCVHMDCRPYLEATSNLQITYANM